MNKSLPVEVVGEFQAQKVHEEESTGMSMHGAFRKQHGVGWGGSVGYMGLELGGEVER